MDTAQLARRARCARRVTLLDNIRKTGMLREQVRRQLVALLPFHGGTTRLKKADLERTLADVAADMFPQPVPRQVCKAGWEWIS